MGMRGADRLRQRLLRTFDAQGIASIHSALFASGNEIQTDAQISISTGSVSGKGHIPSKAGEPPNQDTGVLADGIETLTIKPLHVVVAATAPHSRHLEYGTSKMAERPYLRPAVAKNRGNTAKLVAQAIRANRKRMRGA